MVQAGPLANRSGESTTATLPLIICIALASLLMVADQRGNIGQSLRSALQRVAEPVWWVAAAPGRIGDWVSERSSSHDALRTDNEQLTQQLRITTAQLDRMQSIALENERLRALLGGTRGYRLQVQLAGIVDVDLDPFRQRVVLDRGSRDGVQVGQAVIDDGGMVGQVIEVTSQRAVALLITDAEHAVPVQIVRTGLRLIAYGTEQPDRLRVTNIPQSADVRNGDKLVTSGIGGVFPAGFPVGTISQVQPDETQLFLTAAVTPAANLDRGRDVLLVSRVAPDTDVGPPNPNAGKPVAVDPAATGKPQPPVQPAANPAQ